jgi:hypothetical protein
MAGELSDLTADSLNDMEPQRVNNILLHIVGAPAGTRNDGSSTAVASGTAADAELVLALESFPIPKENQGVIEQRHLNESRKFAGNVTFDPISVVYKGHVNSATRSILRAWRKLVYNATNGKVGFAKSSNGGTAGYKRNGYVTEFAPNGTLVRQTDVFGVFPTNFDPGDADQSGEDFTRITVELSIDKWNEGTAGTPPADYQA